MLRRDEGGRSDRQPEFTQVDMELSFSGPKEVMTVVEALVIALFKEILGTQLPAFPVMAHAEALRRFGSDKPDMRFGLELVELSRTAGEGVLRGIAVPAGATVLTSAVVKEMRRKVEQRWDLGKWDGTAFTGTKLLKPEHAKAMNLKPGDAVVATLGPEDDVTLEACQVLGRVRTLLGETLGLSLNKRDLKFLWVVDFPMFEPRPETAGGVVSAHHPFVAPHPEDAHLLFKDPLHVRGQCYDLVLNGVEVLGIGIYILDSIFFFRQQ